MRISDWSSDVCSSDLDGPHLRCQVERVAKADVAHLLHDLLADIVVDRALHQQPRACDAGLAGSAEHPGDSAGDGRADVGVLDDSVGRFAPELRRPRPQRRCTGLPNLLTPGTPAREAYFAPPGT